VLKAVSGGYDGKGVWVCESGAEAATVLADTGLADTGLADTGLADTGLADAGLDLMAEEYVAFDRELAVLAARSPHRQGAVYPVVQAVQRDGICREVIAPAPGLTPARRAQAQALGLRIAEALGVTGLLAVEMFETPDGLLVNELAMRPHNTGHWTIEGARTSQFEQHLRAVLDLPLGSVAMAAPAAVMANVLGGDDADVYDRYIHVMAADPGVKVHMYGKAVRPGRKIGHVTVTGEDAADLTDRARRAASYLRWGKEDGD
jgi:5-(carboxyamino)imidazole ribonucleotide synthase